MNRCETRDLDRAGRSPYNPVYQDSKRLVGSSLEAGEITSVTCLGGKSEAKPKPGRYECKQCGAVTKKKSHVCKPKKIKG